MAVLWVGGASDSVGLWSADNAVTCRRTGEVLVQLCTSRWDQPGAGLRLCDGELSSTSPASPPPSARC